ncbi:MAG: hypothetical protein D3910_02340 [Candidatus Electrothrix sp. ATG2]|nr:hypothetical protein [Candidatus Electrothrix sp. ATG2]
MTNIARKGHDIRHAGVVANKDIGFGGVKIFLPSTWTLILAMRQRSRPQVLGKTCAFAFDLRNQCTSAMALRQTAAVRGGMVR